VAFRFKHFDIEDRKSTMRVGTDAMLLGSWAEPAMAGKILEIGTGCGVLALMMAQKSAALIQAIDIDLPSVREAGENFRRSPWSERLTAIHVSLGDFSRERGPEFDFIISNPPYFSNSLKSRYDRKNITRHDDALSGSELLQSVTRLLAPQGTFAMILPAAMAVAFTASAVPAGLYVSRRLEVRPKPVSAPNLILMEFRRDPVKAAETGSLSILGEDGKYSVEYLKLTAGFHSF
jgi:tRNA1Val (adenine37-N6)-methyltransferase